MITMMMMMMMMMMIDGDGVGLLLIISSSMVRSGRSLTDIAVPITVRQRERRR
jgi:hypothetical protein